MVSVCVGGGGCVCVVSVAAVSVGGAVSVVSVGGGGRRSIGRGCVVITIGAGGRGIGAGGGIPLDIAPGCCGGITPVVGPAGMFGGGIAVPSANEPVVSVFVAVAIGGRTSPGTSIVDVALVVCPS